MIGTTSNIVGNLLGFLIPHIMINPRYSNTAIYSEQQL